MATDLTSITYTINFSNSTLVSTVGTVAEVVLFQLPIRGKIVGVTIKSGVAFTASGLTLLNVSLAAAAGTVVMLPYVAATAYSPVYDLTLASTDTNYYDDGGQASATEAAHNVVARFTSAGANLSTLTAGTVHFTICWFTRPTGTVIP